MRSAWLPVIKVEVEGDLEVDDIPTQMSTGNIVLPVGMSKCHNEGGGLSISGMDRVDRNYPYFSMAGQDVVGRMDTKESIQTFRSTYRPEFASELGTITIDPPGVYRAVLCAEKICSNDPYGLIIYEVKLEK